MNIFCKYWHVVVLSAIGELRKNEIMQITLYLSLEHQHRSVSSWKFSTRMQVYYQKVMGVRKNEM